MLCKLGSIRLSRSIKADKTKYLQSLPDSNIALFSFKPLIKNVNERNPSFAAPLTPANISVFNSM